MLVRINDKDGILAEFIRGRLRTVKSAKKVKKTNKPKKGQK